MALPDLGRCPPRRPVPWNPSRFALVTPIHERHDNMVTLKHKIALAAVPLARVMVKHAPPSRLREWLWHWGHWRAKDFRARAGDVELTGNTRDVIQRYLYWFGVWEPNLTQFVRQRMAATPQRTFVDIGANIGYFSTLVAKSHPNAKVVAIEAYPPTVEKLRRHISRNGLSNVRVVPSAVSDQHGSLNFFFAGTDNEGATTSVPGRFESDVVQVPCSPLTDLLTTIEMDSIRLMKIDVEGAEASVVRGMTGLLARLPADAEVVVEVCADSVEETRYIFDAFGQNGFYPYELDNSYDPLTYLYPSAPQRPRRLRALPTKMTDVVFSRLNAESL